MDESGFEHAHHAVEKLRNGLLKIVAVGTGVAVALREITREAADHSREILRTAKITGMGTEALQGLDYAAKLSGVSAEELHQGLVRLARSALETAKGSGTAGYAYQRLGVHVSSAAGKLRPLNDIFTDVAGALQKMPDGTEKAALSMQLFGRAGAQLIPLLDQGPEGLARFTEEAKKLGLVMDEKTLAAGNRYRITLDRLSGAVEGLKHGIAERLLPAFTRTTEKFIKWIVAHREWIALHVEKAFGAVSQVMQGLLAIGMGVVNIFERIWKSGATGKGVLIGLAAAVALFTAPWMSLVAVLALVAEDIEGYFEGKDSITGRIVYAFEQLKKKLSIEWKLFKADPFGKLKEWATKFFDWFVEKASALPDAIAKAIGEKRMKAWSDFVLKDLGLDLTDQPGSIGEKLTDWEWARNHPATLAGQKELADKRATPSFFDDMWAAMVAGPHGSNAFGQPLFPLPSFGAVSPFVRSVTGGGGVTFAPTINVTAGPGTDGTQVGKDIGDALVTHEDLGRMLREAHAASNKQNVP